MSTPTPPSVLLGREAMMATYSPPNLAFESGRGVWLHGNDGKDYLDFYSGIAVSAFGHNHPYLVKALQEASEKVWHLSNMFRIPQAERLATRLCEQSFATKVFFTNSGAESNECGLKAIRKYQAVKAEAAGHNCVKNRIIGFSSAFHGRTIATVGAGGNPAHMKGFLMEDEGFDQVPYGDLAALEAAITEQTAGVILEPVQGEGGIRPADEAFFRGVRRLCDEHDILMMVDEVQCGMGRTGKLFAHQWYGVEPDIMSLAKGIGGGFPLGACLANDKAAAAMVFGTHGSTYGGNPLATAIGNAVLDLLSEEGFLESVQSRAAYLQEKLAGLIARYPNVYDSVSGKGLMLGFKCVVPNGDVLVSLRDDHQMLVAKSGDNQVRMLPPLNVTEAEIDTAIDRLAAAAETLLARAEG
ncbi:aspartate aminotransferase family protein [Kiloniella sp. b19]|uniref:aspartate aminotransferase family protein n=1 Tax=Kiloniella sp. GXU_MW_B19 TaxID=3141326 RepID=UPI0031CE1D65